MQLHIWRNKIKLMFQSTNEDMALILPNKKTCPIPPNQARPCHVLRLDDYLPTKKRVMSGVTEPSLHEEQYEENSKAASTENCS